MIAVKTKRTKTMNIGISKVKSLVGGGEGVMMETARNDGEGAMMSRGEE